MKSASSSSSFSSLLLLFLAPSRATGCKQMCSGCVYFFFLTDTGFKAQSGLATVQLALYSAVPRDALSSFTDFGKHWPAEWVSRVERSLLALPCK
ncbi:hypothetical protein IF1G_02638 [Cordyceps javanica]|uniref:Secreted protein n=1 Tax=Cordyceps javanica TaxID=43265 RepID=A0A545VA01_9HYPO|nr:hypothetical protein IF1G_02638 [Cordyceps javanica]